MTIFVAIATILQLNKPNVEFTLAEPEPPSRTIQMIAREKISEKFGSEHWESFDKLIQKESGWNWQAVNKSSGACGLPQALPCSKMGELGKTPEGQIDWAISYIADRYETPNNAWSFHLNHNWY